MSVSIVSNSSENLYANDRRFLQSKKSELKGEVSIVTYKNNLCLCDRVGQIALAVFLLMLTLGTVLLIAKARTWIAHAFEEFKEKTVIIYNEDRGGQTNPVQVLPAITSNPVTAPLAMAVAPHQMSQLPNPLAPVPALIKPVIPQNMPLNHPTQPVALSPQQLAHVNFLESVKQEMLKTFPRWVPIVEKWDNVSIEDQVWLLELFSFRTMCVTSSAMENIFQSLSLTVGSQEIISDALVPAVLKAKNLIEQDFAQMDYIQARATEFFRMPAILTGCRELKRLELRVNSKVLKCELDLSIFPKLKQFVFLNSKFYRLPIFHENTGITHVEFTACEVEEVIVPSLKKLVNLQRFEFSSCGENDQCFDFDFSANKRLHDIRMPWAKLRTLPKLPRIKREMILHFHNNKRLDAQSKQKLQDLKPQVAELFSD